MMKRISILPLLGMCPIAAMAAPLPNPNLVNAGFEEGPNGWRIGSLTSLRAESAHTGEKGIHILDTSSTAGSSLFSSRIPVTPGKYYLVEYFVRDHLVTGSSVGLYFKFHDAAGKAIDRKAGNNELITIIPKAANKEWRKETAIWQAPQDTASLALWVHSFSNGNADLDLDDFSIREIPAEEGRKLVEKYRPREIPANAPERVKALAAILPERPSAPGARITDRAAWDRLAALPEAKNILKQARSSLKNPIPEVPDEWYLDYTRNGNRTRFQKPYFLRTSILNKLILAECLENKGTFLPKIEEVLQAICRERSWTMPAHDTNLSNFHNKRLTIDLGSSARGWMLAVAYDWLQDRLSAETKATIVKEIKRRILQPYYTAIKEGTLNGNWWIRGENNWNAVCHAGVLGTAFALETDRNKRAEILATVEQMHQHFVSGFTDDGYCSEGMGYWNYGFGHDIMMGLTIRHATQGKFDLFQGKKMRKIAEYARGYQLQPRRSPWFADGGGAPDFTIWSLMRQIWPDAVPEQVASLSLLRGNCMLIGLRAFGQDPGTIENPKSDRLPIRTWFNNAQVLISRLDPASTATPFSIAMKGGHNNEQHNHNDVGSYTIMLDGIEMTGDPGGEVYTRRTFSAQRYVSKMLNSYGHPVPIVAGTLQPAGRAFHATIVKTAFTPEQDTLALDLTRAYPSKSLRSLIRTMTFNRKERTVSITDTVVFNKPETFSVPLITYQKMEQGDTPSHLTLVNPKGKQQVLVKIDTQGKPWDGIKESIENPNKTSPTRYAVTLKEPVTQAAITLTFTAK